MLYLGYILEDISDPLQQKQSLVTRHAKDKDLNLKNLQKCFLSFPKVFNVPHLAQFCR